MDLWLIVLVGSVIFLGLVWGFLYQLTRHPAWPRAPAATDAAPERGAPSQDARSNGG